MYTLLARFNSYIFFLQEACFSTMDVLQLKLQKSTVVEAQNLACTSMRSKSRQVAIQDENLGM